MGFKGSCLSIEELHLAGVKQKQTAKKPLVQFSLFMTQETGAESEFDNPPMVLKLHLCLGINVSVSLSGLQLVGCLNMGESVRTRTDVR